MSSFSMSLLFDAWMVDVHDVGWKMTERRVRAKRRHFLGVDELLEVIIVFTITAFRL